MLGESSLGDCSFWRNAAEESSTDDALVDVPGTKLPWTGNAFGASDVGFLAGSARTRVVGVMGAASSGKTSLLGSWYLLLARGVTPTNVSFAGSLTLEGWENIASCMRWNSQNGPAFPAHTSSGTGRHPGLLHLKLSLDSKSSDFLFADAPGEWFSRWAVRRDAEEVAGARWLSQSADVLVVVADSDTLAGPRRGTARLNLTELLRRVGDERRGRPVALVWSKSDVQVSTEMTAAIEQTANLVFGEYVTFRVSMRAAPGHESANRGQGLLELFEWVTTVQDAVYPRTVESSPERELLHLVGGIHV